MEADASPYRGVPPEEADSSAPERQTRAVAEFLRAIYYDYPTTHRKPPKVISKRPVLRMYRKGEQACAVPLRA